MLHITPSRWVPASPWCRVQALVVRVQRQRLQALVVGAGRIGMFNALAALAGGCSRVMIADVPAKKLAVAD